MAYHCPDCGYRSTKVVHSAQCPACDSFAIQSTSRVESRDEQTPAQRRNRLIVLVLLWAYLIYEIYLRLYT